VTEQVATAVAKSKAIATLPSLAFIHVGDTPSSVGLMSFMDVPFGFCFTVFVDFGFLGAGEV
jgi:hypothetical protein